MNPLIGWNIIDRTELKKSVSYSISHDREIRQDIEYQKRLEKARQELFERYRNRSGNARYFHSIVLPQIKETISKKYNVKIDDLPKI